MLGPVAQSTGVAAVVLLLLSFVIPGPSADETVLTQLVFAAVAGVCGIVAFSGGRD